MNWNTKSANQRGTYAAEGENSPRSLVAETFFDSLPIGEPSPIISYEIASEKCLIVAHFTSQTLKVEAVGTDANSVFSQSTTLLQNDDRFTCIKYCESQDWLLVGMNANLYLFDALDGTLLHSFALGLVDDIYETSSGQIIANYRGFEFHLLEYDSQLDDYVSTLLWTYGDIGNKICGYWAPGDVLAIAEDVSNDSKLSGFSLLDGTEKWALELSDTWSLDVWGFDAAGNLYCSYLESLGEPNYNVAYSRFAKRDSSNGNLIWEVDLTERRAPFLALQEFGNIDGDIIVLGTIGSPTPWGAYSTVDPPDPPEEAEPGDFVVPLVLGTGGGGVTPVDVAICEDAIYLLHISLGTAYQEPDSTKLITLDPLTGAPVESVICSRPLGSEDRCLAANSSGGSWVLANLIFQDHSLNIHGRMLFIDGLAIDPQGVLILSDDLDDSTLPVYDYDSPQAPFERACIVDGNVYYPRWNSSTSQFDINVMGEPYVDDREERDCRKTDCCSSCTTRGQYALCIAGLEFKSCIYDASPSSMGYGWNFPAYKYLEEKSNGDLVYHDGTGMFERWIRSDNDKFFPAHPDNYIKAFKNLDDSYSLKHPDGSTMNFDVDSKRIVTWVDTNDNTTTYHYEEDGDERLILIEDGEGRETHIDYGGRSDGQPVSISSHIPSVGSARQTVYTYYPTAHANEDRLWKITNPENETTTFEYYPDGRMDKVIDPRNKVAKKYTYQTDGRVETITSYGEMRESFTYDDINKSYTQQIEDLTDVSSEIREIVRFFDKYHNIVEVRQKISATEWNITKRYFESPHNPYLLTKEVAPNMAMTTYIYTARGNLREVEDPQGNKTTFRYMEDDDPSHDIPDLMTQIARPFTSVVSRQITNLVYDSKGNLTKTIDALGNEVNYTYLADGRVWKIENELEDVTVFTYQGTPHDGSFRHLQKVEIPTDTGTRDITYVFDDFDNVLEIENELMEKIVYTYDDLNRVLTVKDPEQAVTTFHYQDGLMDYTLLPPNQASGSSNARQVTMMHDDVGRVVQSKMATGLSTELVRASYDYTGFSELKTLTRPKGASDPEFNFQYDRLGRPTVMTDPLSESSSTAYEPYCVGRAVTSARGVRTKMEFDTRCQLTTVTTGDQGANPLDVSNPRITRTFTYDELGRMTGSTQSPNDIASRPLYGRAKFGESRYGQTALVPNHGERTYEYDELDRLIRMVFEDGSDVNYEYDEASRLTKKTDIDDKVTEYGYRKDHLLKTLTVKRESQSDRVFTYSYDEAGRVTQVQYPGESQLIAYIDNGTPGTGWDRNGRLKHLRYELNGSPLRSFAYDYDESGNRTQATEVAGSTTTVYKYYYDWLDRLLRVEKGPNTSSLSPVSIYTYDESDNPTKLELPEAFLEYDFTFDLASNIETRKETDITTPSAPVVNFTENFTPDEDGNVLTRTRTVGADTHQITYEWDDFNKLVSVSASLNGSPAAEPKQSNAYAVNGFRRQKTKKDGEILTEYAEGLATAVAKAQAETITYIHGHQILGFEQGGQFYYFLTDALGSVRDIVDGTGQVVQQYQYDERGNHVIAPMSGGPASPKTFVGGLSVNDDTSDGGLYLMGHRFYDPSLGRFLNRDPIGFAGGLNLFSYGANNPVTRVDPLGLRTVVEDAVQTVVGAVELAVGTAIALEPTPTGEALMVDGARRMRSGLMGLGVTALFTGVAAAASEGVYIEDEFESNSITVAMAKAAQRREEQKRRGDIYFERFGCKEEAQNSAAANRLLQRPGHPNAEKWIAKPGLQNWKNLGKPKYHDWKMTIRARKEAQQWLDVNAIRKPNEPWAYGIPANKLAGFNLFVVEITATSARK